MSAPGWRRLTDDDRPPTAMPSREMVSTRLAPSYSFSRSFITDTWRWLMSWTAKYSSNMMFSYSADEDDSAAGVPFLK